MTLTKEERTKYLKILGLGPDASNATIKRVYKRLQRLYTSEIHLISSILNEFPKRKKQAVIRELEDAYDKISVHFENEQSLNNKKMPYEDEKLEEERPEDFKLNSRMQQDIRKKLVLTEKKEYQEFVTKIDGLMKKGTALISSMNEVMKQLQNLERRFKAEDVTNKGLQDKLNSLTSKVGEIQRAYSYSEEGVAEYKKSAKGGGLRVGTLPEQISRLRGSISRSQKAPTQIQIDQFNYVKRKVVSLLKMASEIKEKEIPDLNKSLNEINFLFIKISKLR